MRLRRAVSENPAGTQPEVVLRGQSYRIADIPSERREHLRTETAQRVRRLEARLRTRTPKPETAEALQEVLHQILAEVLVGFDPQELNQGISRREFVLVMRALENANTVENADLLADLFEVGGEGVH